MSVTSYHRQHLSLHKVGTGTTPTVVQKGKLIRVADYLKPLWQTLGQRNRHEAVDWAQTAIEVGYWADELGPVCLGIKRADLFQV